MAFKIQNEDCLLHLTHSQSAHTLRLLLAGNRNRRISFVPLKSLSVPQRHTAPIALFYEMLFLITYSPQLYPSTHHGMAFALSDQHPPTNHWGLGMCNADNKNRRHLRPAKRRRTLTNSGGKRSGRGQHKTG